MKAEYFIGINIVWFLVGWFIRDLGSLGADSPSERRTNRAASRDRSTAPRKPW